MGPTCRWLVWSAATTTEVHCSVFCGLRCTWYSSMKVTSGRVQLTRMSSPSIAAVTSVGGSGGTTHLASTGPAQSLLPTELTDRTRYEYRVSPTASRWVKEVMLASTLAVSASPDPAKPYWTS